MGPITIDSKMLFMFNSILSFSSHQLPINKGAILTLKIWLLVMRKISQFKKRKVNKMLHSIQFESVGVDVLLYTRAASLSADGKLCLLKAILQRKRGDSWNLSQSEHKYWLSDETDQHILSIQQCKTIYVYNVDNICSDPHVDTLTNEYVKETSFCF